MTGETPLNLASRSEIAEFFPEGFLDKSAFSFAALITKTSHEQGLNDLCRVFSSNTLGGPINSQFHDEIGIRSWPADQCWIYAYGADGAEPRSSATATVVTASSTRKGGCSTRVPCGSSHALRTAICRCSRRVDGSRRVAVIAQCGRLRASTCTSARTPSGAHKSGRARSATLSCGTGK